MNNDQCLMQGLSPEKTFQANRTNILHQAKVCMWGGLCGDRRCLLYLHHLYENLSLLYPPPPLSLGQFKK
eukprot:UN10178